jgi:16S rRNA (uracil1498-N3)-methyltransferase
MERMEWMVEKLTEIGVGKIGFIVCSNSERKEIKLERLRKKAVSAMKQSLKTRLPEILPIVKLETLVVQIRSEKNYIAHCYPDLRRTNLPDQITNSEKINVLIGPEGDFTRDEVSLALGQGIQAVSFGESRLRTETAAMVACTLINKAFVLG